MNIKKIILSFTSLITLFFQAALPNPVYASGIVGTGTSGSCTEASLDTALIAGGAVSFNCGGSATIILTTTKVISANTQIDGGGVVTLSGGNTVRLFTVNSPSTLNLSNLTITNGFVTDANGGAILVNNGATVNISNATLSSNQSMNGYGGAIYVGGGNLTITDSTFTANNANVEIFGDVALGGGAIENNDGTVNISGSTFNGNSVTSHTADGGAIYNGDYDGGFVDNNGIPDSIPDVLTVTNSTFYNNHVTNPNTSGEGDSGGAIRSTSVLTLVHNTFSNNDSGDVINVNDASGAVTISEGTAVLRDNIFANSTGADCAIRLFITSLTSTGNLIETNSPQFGGCGVPAVSADPLLGPLQDNGGPTQTMALGNGSPAIDALGSCAAATDQRGVIRPQPSAGNCDIGAYEVDTTPPSVNTILRANSSPTSASSVGFNVTFTESVTGVDVLDFGVTTTGSISGASISGISGSGSSYVVTVNTGSGNGNLGLDFVSDGTVHDITGNTITGSHVGDESYTVERDAPSVISITRASVNPTNLSSVSFAVTFSEPVVNVGTNDFALTTTGVSGTSITNVSGTGTSYTVTVNTGTGDGTIRLDVPVSATVQDLAANALGSLPFNTGEVYTINKSTTFADVPSTHPFYRYIEAFYKAGITTGCSQSPKLYCPDNLVTRAEMAVFIERAKGNFAPNPNPKGMFSDLPYPGLETFTPFIEQFYNDKITTGCQLSPLMYCPQNNVNRAEMATFIERAIGHFNPQPNPSGMFGDVPAVGLEGLTKFIEQFYNDGITTGCQPSPLLYCPTNKVTRAEMAVFIVRAFHIPLP